MSRSIVVSDNTYKLIMRVYSVFRDVFDSLDDFIHVSSSTPPLVNYTAL